MRASKLGHNRTEDAKIKNKLIQINFRNLYLYEKHLYLLINIILILQNV